MQRRSFLSMLGAASAAPLMPAPALGAATKTASYNAYTYGYAVFKARFGGALVASDLAATMKVSTQTAQAMIAQMTSEGVVRPVANGAVTAVKTHGGGVGSNGFMRKTVELAQDVVEHFQKDQSRKAKDVDLDVDWDGEQIEGAQPA